MSFIFQTGEFINCHIDGAVYSRMKFVNVIKLAYDTSLLFLQSHTEILLVHYLLWILWAIDQTEVMWYGTAAGLRKRPAGSGSIYAGTEFVEPVSVVRDKVRSGDQCLFGDLVTEVK